MICFPKWSRHDNEILSNLMKGKMHKRIKSGEKTSRKWENENKRGKNVIRSRIILPKSDENINQKRPTTKMSSLFFVCAWLWFWIGTCVAATIIVHQLARWEISERTQNDGLFHYRKEAKTRYNMQRKCNVHFQCITIYKFFSFFQRIFSPCTTKKNSVCCIFGIFLFLSGSSFGRTAMHTHVKCASMMERRQPIDGQRLVACCSVRFLCVFSSAKWRKAAKTKTQNSRRREWNEKSREKRKIENELLEWPKNVNARSPKRFFFLSRVDFTATVRWLDN